MKETEKNKSPEELCKERCAYYTCDRIKVINKYTFLVAIAAILGFAILYFAYSNYVYRSSFQSIIDNHKIYVTKVEHAGYASLSGLNVDSITADSKAVLEALVAEQQALTQIHKEEASALDSLLEMHSQRIGSDFSNLMLWASVLMIVFLVFSIYSMYKMDEMQNRGNESLNKIYETRNAVMAKIDELKQMYQSKVSEIQNASELAIQSIQSKTKELEIKIDGLSFTFSAESDKQKERYGKAISELSEAQQQQARTVIEEQMARVLENINNQVSAQIVKFTEQTKTEKEEIVRLLETAKNSAKLKEAGTPTTTGSAETNNTINGTSDNAGEVVANQEETVGNKTASPSVTSSETDDTERKPTDNPD